MNYFTIIENILQCIQKYYPQNISLSALEKDIAYNHSDIDFAFKTYFNCPINDFLKYTQASFIQKHLKNLQEHKQEFLHTFWTNKGLRKISINYKESFQISSFDKVSFAFHNSIFGLCFIAVHQKGICELAFINQQSKQENVLQNFNHKWRNAEKVYDKEATKLQLSLIFENLNQPLNIYLVGTTFQLEVWKSLLQIPFGTFTHYESIAINIKRLKAFRAVGTAVGANPIAFIIPCHRVVGKNGVLGNYRWGKNLKLAMQSCELYHQYYSTNK